MIFLVNLSTRPININFKTCRYATIKIQTPVGYVADVYYKFCITYVGANCEHQLNKRHAQESFYDY